MHERDVCEHNSLMFQSRTPSHLRNIILALNVCFHSTRRILHEKLQNKTFRKTNGATEEIFVIILTESKENSIRIIWISSIQPPTALWLHWPH